MDKGALFDSFVAASTFRSIQHSFYQLCTALDIDSADSSNVYKQLRMLADWKAQKLWKLLDKRVDQAEYRKQKAASQLNTLIIGAGPCGLRAAIECALLGSRVVVVEQRDRFSRNNVLHLWEFVIHDLKTLGAKIFYPKFCTGSIEHISIRQLQCILLKVALCFGVQVHESVSFVELLFPKEEDGRVSGFRASLEPKGHILSEFDIDVLIGADGKRNTIPGFPRDEMRGKLAIGITANFINNKTPAEERVPEISGVAYIFNQAFFKEMYDKTGVDLENIVYYKDETHYFVMCAKKQSLIEMGVIKKDFDDVDLLLSNDNVDRSALGRYAQSAADFATNGKLPSLNFATNHRGHEDIAMFDFTSLYSSRCSVRLVERLGKYLLMGIVGDSLHEPFWPTGSGCARGFLGVLDTAWLIRDYGINQKGPLEIIAERESVYRLLTQVTKDNLHKSISKYTIDPRTRYVSLEISLQPEDVIQIVSTDNPRMAPINQPLIMNNSTSVHCDPHLEIYGLWRFCQQTLSTFKLRLYDMDMSWRDGRALAGLINKFRPDILDSTQIQAVKDPVIWLNSVFDAVWNYMEIPSPCKPEEWVDLAKDAKLDYICKVVGLIRADKDQLKRSLITPRSHSTQKRTVLPQQKINRKRSEPIEKLAQDLLGCSSFQVANSIKKFPKKESTHDILPEKCTKKLDRTDSKDKTIATNNLEYRYKTTTEQKDEDGKHYTKRPQVDRLNPELVHKVEKIVTGDLLKEQISNMYADKDRKARKNTHKMNKNNIAEMEKKLEQTGMGLLYNRKDHMSSQDEKIIRVNAADARKEAESGFTKEAEVQRFKEYDEKIRKSDNVMKKRELVGLDPFCKWKAQNTTECDSIPDGSRKTLPPTPPKKSVTVENLQNGAIAIRPIAPVQPKQHLALPLTESSCDSVNPRRQENCHLCNKVVYLAERMQVESMYIHKNCFRCAYCGQPLRLGEYGKDKDLEYHYSKKFFCKIHLRVPLREKIARIERTVRHTSRPTTKENHEMLVREKSLPSTEVVIPTPVTDLSIKKNNEFQRSTVLNFFSPEQLRDRTVQRMRDQRIRDIISPISDLSTTDDRTPERAEFGSHIRQTSITSSLKTKQAELNQSASGSDSEDDIDQEFISSTACGTIPDAQVMTSIGDVKERSQSVEVDDEESLTDDDDAQLEEDDLEELERTVLQIADENPEKPFTDAQVVSVIDKINRRRSAQQMCSSMNSLNSPLALSRNGIVNKELDKTNIEEFHTPLAVSFRKSRLDEGINMSASTIPVLSMESNDQFLTPRNMADDIKKRKIADLERLRTESRMKAKMKTDEELGLGTASVSTDRRSVPCLEISTPINVRSNTVSPPRDRNKIRALSMIDNMPTNYSSIAQRSQPFVNTDRQPLPPSIGLLSKLFSPDAIRKKSNSPMNGSETPVNPEKVHCESRKETNILGNAFRRLKMKRSETNNDSILHSTPSSPLPSSSVTISTDSREVPCAAVAPSPRVHSELLESPSSSSQMQISVNNKNIRLFQKKAEKIRRQHDEERRRNAQEIQRGLQECEIRYEEIKVRGEVLEKKLSIDPTNHWDLNSWFALVQEREVLKCKEEMLRLNKREMELEVKYRDLNLRFKQMGEGLNDNLIANSELLAAMLTVVEEKKEVKKLSEKSKQGFKRIRNTMDLLKEKGSNFHNFDPVFTA